MYTASKKSYICHKFCIFFSPKVDSTCNSYLTNYGQSWCRLIFWTKLCTFFALKLIQHATAVGSIKNFDTGPHFASILWRHVLSIKRFGRMFVLSWEIWYTSFLPAKFVSSFTKVDWFLPSSYLACLSEKRPLNMDVLFVFWNYTVCVNYYAEHCVVY